MVISEPIQCLQVPDKIFCSSTPKKSVSQFDMISNNVCNSKIILKLRSIHRNYGSKFETFEHKWEIGIYCVLENHVLWAWSEFFGLPAIASSGEAGGLCLEIQPGSVGPPWRDYVGKRFCYCFYLEIEAPRLHSHKIRSGPGSIGELSKIPLSAGEYWNESRRL